MNPKVVEKLIGSNFVHDLDEIAVSKDTSFYTSRDSNFIEFTNEFAFGDQADSGKETEITLKMHDEGLNFLKKFHYEGMAKTLSVFRDAKYTDIATEANALAERRDELEILLEGQTTTLSNLEAQDESRSWVDSALDFAVDIFTDDDKELGTLMQNAEKLIESYTEELTEIYKKLDIYRSKLGQKGFPKVYIAYGVGTDIKDWAGPLECYLGDIQYDNNGRKETTTYKFLVNVLTASYRSLNPGFSNRSHRTNTLVGWSTPLVAYSQEVALRGVTMKRIDFTSFSRSIHDAVVRLLSGYLYANGIKNHLIVLPDLDSVLLPLMQECFDKYLKSLGVNPWKPDGSYNRNFVSTTYIDTFLAGLDRFEKSGNPGPHVNWASLLFADELKTGTGVHTSDINVLQAIINQLFTRLGIHVVKTESRSASPDPAVPIRTLGKLTSAGYSPGGVDPSVDVDVSAVGATSFAFGGAGGYNNEDIFDSFTGDKIEDASFGWLLNFPWFNENTAPGEAEGGVDILAPIRLLFKDMEQSSGETMLDFEAFWENNTRIKNKFFEKFGGGTYFGYAGRRGPDSDDPFLILGDSQTIRSFLYGEIDWEDDGIRSPMERDIELNNHHIPKGSEFHVPIKDRFWKSIAGDLQAVGKTSAPTGRPVWFDVILETVLARTRHNGFFANKHYTSDPRFSDPAYADGYARNVIKSMLPDEFASAPDGSFWANRFLKLATPIFTANTRNANVTEYKFDASKWMMAQFFGVFEEVWYNQYERFVSGDLPDTTTMTSDEIRDKILVIMDRYTVAGSTGLPSLRWAVSPGMRADIGELSNNLCDLLYLESAGSYTAIDKGSGGLALNYVLLFKSLFESVFIGTMKTVPMFHLTQAHIHTRPALVFLKSTRKVSPVRSYTGTYNSSDFFSGVYRILGYKHTISTKNAFSQFLVHRDLVGDIANED